MMARRIVGLGTVLLLVNFAEAAPDSNHVAGVALLKSGDFTGAQQRLEKAYRAHAANAAIAFDYARVAPCSVSVAIFTRLAADAKTSDSLRAASYVQLGDYSFVNNAFRTAAERYHQAYAITGEPAYRYLQAFSLAAAHDTVAARPIFIELAEKTKGDWGSQAAFRLGLIEMKLGAFDAALKHFTRAGQPDTAGSWTIALAAAKLECALRLGKTDSVKIYEKQLQPFRGELLEKDLLELAGALSEKKPKVAPQKVTDNAGAPDSVQYTLQVGAFGSLDNATSLQKKLEPRFKDVSILPVTIADQVFYRVRIGTFKTRTAAETFGKDSCVAAGIAFKAVEK